LAQKLADEYEAATRARMTEAQVRRVLSDLHKLTSGSTLPSASVRSYLDQWISAKRGTVAESTKTAYEATAREFCEYLGKRAGEALVYIEKSDIAGFRDRVASSRAPAAANGRLKILRIALQQAWRDGVLDENPAGKVPLLKVVRAHVTSRRPFAPKELQSLIRAADGDWKGVILFGVYTGQRLGDIVPTPWGQSRPRRANARVHHAKDAASPGASPREASERMA